MNVYKFIVTYIIIIVLNGEDLELKKLLTGDRTKWERFSIGYQPLIELKEEIWWQTQMTPDEIYDSHNKYPSKHSLNYLIDEDEIELIINEDDIIATQQFIDGFTKELFDKTDGVTDRFYKLQEEMGGKYNLSIDDFDTDLIEINGYSPPEYWADPDEGNRYTTGMHGELFKMSRSCVQFKNCNVYPIWRVIHKTKSIPGKLSFSCNDIMTKFLPQIYKCIDKYGVDDCKLIIDNGYFRDVFKVQDPYTKTWLVLKMMRPLKFDDHARDLQRNVRESIMLYYLRKEELEYMKKYGPIFTSFNQDRAFPYVRELGHCIYPSYMTITPYYNNTLEKFVKKGCPAYALLLCR